jgi:hypothetical protein
MLVLLAILTLTSTAGCVLPQPVIPAGAKSQCYMAQGAAVPHCVDKQHCIVQMAGRKCNKVTEPCSSAWSVTILAFMFSSIIK